MTAARPESFRISTTDRIGRRWWWVRLYHDVESLRRAAAAYAPGVDFSECYGVCQAARWYDEAGAAHWGRGSFGGVIRYALPHLTGEIAAHELGHAALATYRGVVVLDPRFGRGIGEREEQLCYLFGELYASFEDGYHRLRTAAAQ